MTCTHTNAVELRPPNLTQSVYREDCTQCFDSIDSPEGLYVCLFCFNGGCAGERNHAHLHYTSTTHPLAVNIQRTRKKVRRDEPPQKLSKLAITAETEADRYDTVTRVDCFACKAQDIDKSPGKIGKIVDAILSANTFAQNEEVKAWEQEMIPCEHTLTLQQEAARSIASQDLGQCAACDLKENLWLCLTCGNLACGRAQFGGVGGNGHALAHTGEANHPVAVKLGSLTADGTADIYCYACNEERVDPDLASHLQHWGINISERQKTEKTLTELQIEQNLKYDFSMTTEEGKDAKPLFGPGFTGLKNLGNSCYLSSIIQCLFAEPEFKSRYYHPEDPPPNVPQPADDLETQLRKIADGLLSGRYSYPDNDVITSSDETEVPHQKGIVPAMLKHLIGRGHAEFSTMRQQDAFELLLHLLQLISRAKHPDASSNPVEAFRFVMEQRLQCLNCKKVRYRAEDMENISIPVPIRRIEKTSTETTTTEDNAEATPQKEVFQPVTIKECLDSFTSPEIVELTCSSCESKAGFSKQSLFKTFPSILAINARRFELVNWIPTKQDVPVIVGDEPFAFDAYKSQGLQPGEEELPEDSSTTSTGSGGFVPNEVALSQLEAMGFPRVRCEKALKATGNNDAEAASLWLFEHMEDPDIDVPEPTSSVNPSGGSANISAEQIENLVNMGFNLPQARQALVETDGNMERAVDWLFSHPDAPGDFGGDEPAAGAANATEATLRPIPGSDALPAKFELQSIVCHKGSSIHAGHYVAFIRKEPTGANQSARSWILFNDEKVAQAADVDEMKKFAYVYFFRRV